MAKKDKDKKIAFEQACDDVAVRIFDNGNKIVLYCLDGDRHVVCSVEDNDDTNRRSEFTISEELESNIL